MVRRAAAMTIFFMEIPCVRMLEARCFGRPVTGGPEVLICEGPPAAGSRRIMPQPSLRRGLGVHVDDLNAAVDRVHRRVRILWLGLAIADGDEVGAVDAVFVDQVPLDGIGAALGEV